MMKTADFGNLHDHAHLRSLDWPPIWRVLLERKVSSRRVIVREVARQDAAQMAVAQDEDVIEALAPDRTDEPFREGILPGATRGREDFLDVHAPDSASELFAVDLVTIAQEIRGRRVVWEGVHDLRAVQWAVGCSVTLKWTTRRR